MVAFVVVVVAFVDGVVGLVVVVVVVVVGVTDTRSGKDVDTAATADDGVAVTSRTYDVPARTRMGAGARATEEPAERSVVNRIGAGAGAEPWGTAETTTFTPRSSTFPWSARTSSTLSVDVAGTTLTPVPPGTAAGVVVRVTKAIRWTASNVVEPTTDATNCPTAVADQTSGCDTHLDTGSRADPGARRNVRRHAVHDASAARRATPAPTSVLVAPASSPPPRPNRPPRRSSRVRRT